MITTQPKWRFINRDLLKILAVLFMLLDHVWRTLLPDVLWLHLLGRIAFPLFAFMIIEGLVHTSDFRKYIYRLIILALISEIPFNLFISGSLIYPYYQNVIFTLLLGLLAAKLLQDYILERSGKNLAIAAMGAVAFPLLADFFMTDYGSVGVMTVIIFYLFRGMRFGWLLQLVSLYIFNVVMLQGLIIPVELGNYVYEIPTQGFALFALIPIWLYNGTRGRGGKVMQYFVYVFYPLHLLVLYFLTLL